MIIRAHLDLIHSNKLIGFIVMSVGPDCNLKELLDINVNELGKIAGE